MKNLKDLKLVQKYFEQSSPFITTYTGLHKKKLHIKYNKFEATLGEPFNNFLYYFVWMALYSIMQVSPQPQFSQPATVECTGEGVVCWLSQPFKR